MARVLVLTFMVITLSCAQAFAQTCERDKVEAISNLSRKLDSISQNLANWQGASRNHVDVERVDTIGEFIEKSTAEIDHITDLLIINNMVNDIVREAGVVVYVHRKVGNLKEALEQNSRVINTWLTRTSHPYVIAEGREARATIDQITSLLAACQPLSRQ